VTPRCTVSDILPFQTEGDRYTGRNSLSKLDFQVILQIHRR